MSVARMARPSAAVLAESSPTCTNRGSRDPAKSVARHDTDQSPYWAAEAETFADHRSNADCNIQRLDAGSWTAANDPSIACCYLLRRQRPLDACQTEPELLEEV